MKISNEARVGIIGIATIAVLIWGINYLKGRNIFNSIYTLYTFYPESGGVASSSPVLINGVKVGYVEDVVLRTNEVPPIKIILSIEKQYVLGAGSVAALASADLLGTSVIKIRPSGRQPEMQHHDTIRGMVEEDFISSLQSRLFPILEKTDMLAVSLDSLSRQMDRLLSQETLSRTLENLADLSTSLSASLSTGGLLDESFRNLESFTGVLDEEKDEMASLIRNLNSISESLDRAGLDTLSSGMTSALSQFSSLLEQLNSGEGSAGKFLHSDTLHESFAVLIADLDSLVRDLNENPENYVQISLFGRSKR
ncbi:MAG: MCE family protein [Bacteroidetes bacterium]|nr:MCE family protein [Bacteroidota bacterium]